MNNRIFSSAGFFERAMFPVVYGKDDSVPINQAPSMEFNIDPQTGRPMSAITSIIRSENAIEQQAAFAQLNEFKSAFLPDDISNEDAFRYAFPSRCQLPSEIASMHEKFAQMKLDEQNAKLMEQQAAKDAEEQELFEEQKKKYVESLKKEN